jgi:hypothetical protein
MEERKTKMFEEKIKLNVEKLDNIIEKEICGQKFKFNTYLEQEYCKFIIDECINRFIEINNENKDFALSIMSINQTINICLCYLTTNIDINNISYEDLSSLGIFKIIENTLINYNEIKENVFNSITMMFNYIIYNTLEQLPNSKQMIENLQEIKDVFTSNPEKAKEFANIVITNHPELKGFGEIFEKILNNLNKEKE